MLHLIFAKKVKRQTRLSSLDGFLLWLSAHTETESSPDFNTTVTTVMQLHHSDLFPKAADRLQTPNNSLQDLSELMILHMQEVFQDGNLGKLMMPRLASENISVLIWLFLLW